MLRSPPRWAGFFNAVTENMKNQGVKQKLEPGDRFGRWTVLGEFILSEKGERKWLCRCDCGTERHVLERSLIYGGSVSCGCLRKERAAQAVSPDLTGRQFGELVVVEKADVVRHGAVQWLCRCACGESCLASSSMLMTGRKTRCGGGEHEKRCRYADITGRRFERLVALYPIGRRDKSGSVIWRCRCDCGGETDVAYNALMYGNQKSCGCQKKEHDRKLQSFLTHVAGTSVDALKSKKIPSDNTTGYKGVYFNKGKYIAKIVFRKKQYFLGAYERIEDAAEARREAEEVLFDGVAAHYQRWKEKAERDPEWAEKNPIQVTVNLENGRLRVGLQPEIP